MNKQDRCIIIFTGFNERAVIAFLRTLEKNNVDYAIIAKSKKDRIFYSKYKNRIISVRNYEELILEDIVNCIKEVENILKKNKYIIAPSTEALNRMINDERKLFESLDCIIPLVEKEVYELISDKYTFGKLCEENNIDIPKELKLDNNINIPFVAKPKKYFSKNKKENLSPIIVKNKNDLEKFYQTYDINDFYYQEYIEGKSIYLLYYFHKNGQVYKFSQENLIQQPNGKSIIAAKATDFHFTFETDKYEKMFKKINFYGIVMIEIRKTNNKNYMIEANPRFWGPSQLFVDCENNFFEVFLHDNKLIEKLPNFKNKTKKYFWFGGMIEVIKNNLNLKFYNIEEEEFLESLKEWIDSDIYAREDTIKIFTEEILYGK